MNRPNIKKTRLRRFQFSLVTLLIVAQCVALVCVFVVAKVYESENQSDVFVGVEGEIVEILVHQGQYVAEGEILAKLSNPELEHAWVTLESGPTRGAADEDRRNQPPKTASDLTVRATSSGKLVSSTDQLQNRPVMPGQQLFTIQRPFPMTGFWIVSTATFIGLLALVATRYFKR